MKIEYLIRELATARTEASILRNRLPSRYRYSKIVRQATIDGNLLLMDAFGDSSTSRRAKLDEGMSIRRWQWAVAFLRYAGLVAMRQNNWRLGLQWLVEDLDQAVALLERAARELEKSDGYKRLATIARRRR